MPRAAAARRSPARLAAARLPPPRACRRRAAMSSFELGKRLDEVLALSNPRVFPASTHATAKVHIIGSLSSIYTNTTAEERTGFPASNCARVLELVSELDGIVAMGQNAFACRDIPFSEVPQPIVAPPGRAYDATRDGLLIFRITKGSRVALHAAMLLPRDGAEIFGSLIWQAIGAVGASGLVPTTARVSTPSGTPPGLGVPGTCAACGAAERAGGSRMLRCSRCQVSFYCSPECQRSHWRAHKPICNAMAAAASRARWHQAPV